MNEIKKEFPQYFHSKSGIRLFYTTNFSADNFDPNKTLIVFNYGLLCNNAHWKHQIPFFTHHNYQILYYDYRGHFSSSGEENISEITISNFSNDIHELIEHLAAKNICMIGHSMGVNVTLQYARHHDEFLKSMILISGTVLPPQDVMFDSNLFDLSLPYLQLLRQMYPKVFKLIWKDAYKWPLARKFVHKGGFNYDTVPDDFISTYMKKIGEISPDMFFQLLQEMHDHDIINHLDKFDIPALIIGGDKDKVIPNYLQNILTTHMKNSTLYIVKDGSHVPQADFPDTVNERMLLFLKKLKG
jgi:non-heme chloroperoxidase